MTIKSKSLLILAAMLALAFLLGAGIVRNTLVNLREADRLRVTLDYLGSFIDIREDMSLLLDSTTDCMLQDVPGSRASCNIYMDRLVEDLDSIYNYVEEHKEQFLNYDNRIRELEIIRSLYAELADSIILSYDILDREGQVPAFNYLENVLEPMFGNKLLVMVSESIKRGSREVESSYLQILLYTNVIPVRWREKDTEVVNLNNAIEYLISVNNADMNIHMQLDELKDYLISGDEKYRLEFLERSGDVWTALNSWLEIVNMRKALRVEGEADDLRQVRRTMEDFNDFERIGIEIAGLVEKGDTEEALRKLRLESDPFMADRLQMGIHHAAEDAKEEITEAYRAIRRKTLVAAAEILLLLIIVVAALSAILITFMRGFTRSLRELGTATGEIGKGNLDFRSGLSTKDELGDLSRFLDSMASDLKNATVSRDYASGIIDAMPEALIMVREDGSIHEVNDSFCALLGFDKDETVGREVHLVAPGIPKPEAFLTELKGLGHVYSMETEFITKDGRSIQMDFSASIISDLHTDFRGYVIAAKDITGRKRLEMDLRRYRDHLMELVAERTMDLEQANFALERRVREVSELKQALLDREGVERRKLGHDLHDGLGQVLTGLAMKSLAHAKSLEGLPGDHQIRAMEIKEVIEQAKTDVRRMARGLSFEDTGERGLVLALEELAVSTEKFFPLQCTFSYVGDSFELAPGVAENLYRIAQEAVTNSASHGSPKNISLRLVSEKNSIELVVEDDGTGMPAAFEGGEGLGLRIMSYRAETIGAQLKFDSAEGKGTTVRCSVPEVLARTKMENEGQGVEPA